MTVIDRDEIIEFFDQDRNFPIFSLLESMALINSEKAGTTLKR